MQNLYPVCHLIFTNLRCVQHHVNEMKMCSPLFVANSLIRTKLIRTKLKLIRILISFLPRNLILKTLRVIYTRWPFENGIHSFCITFYIFKKDSFRSVAIFCFTDTWSYRRSKIVFMLKVANLEETTGLRGGRLLFWIKLQGNVLSTFRQFNME